MTTAVVHQPQYFPYLGFFHKIAHADVYVVMDDVQYQKRGVINRNRIKSSAGPQWLTVPVLQRNGQLIKEVQINPTERWHRQHWNAVRVNYTPAKNFETYAPGLQTLFETSPADLYDLNMASIEWAMDALGIRTPMVPASELGVEGSSSELLANLCRAVGADTYLSGPGGRNYMEPSIFEAAGVAIEWQEFSSPEYEQLFPSAGFVPDLSVVDALMCCGERAKEFIR